MDTAALVERVRRECLASANVFGPSFFEQHLAVVAGYAATLAERLGADPQVVEAAAWLHDIAAVRDAAALPEHARLSAAISRKLLHEAGWPAAAVESAARAIAAHSSPVPLGGGSPEEVCVSNADALAQIARPAYWCYVVFHIRRSGFEEGREWLRRRLQTNWDGLVEPARELIADRYVAAAEQFAL